MSWAVIVPTCPGREEVYKKFIEAWTPLFAEHEVTLITIFDGPEAPKYCEGDHVLSWKDIDDSRFKYIPKKTDMVRSFAFTWAYHNLPHVDYFCTLDDDVRPGFLSDLFAEYEEVFEKGAPCSEYLDVGALTTSGLQMRGFPYKDRKPAEVAVQYGGWDGVLDYDAATQLAVPKETETFFSLVVPVPKGAAVTCCIMNCAWKREYTPIMWQLPMLDGRYNRVGDIWSGLFIKKTLDAVGAVMIINGAARVRHERASNPYESLKKEAPSVWLNDNLWPALETTDTGEVFNSYPEKLLDWYDRITNNAALFFWEHDEQYGRHFIDAKNEWVEQFR